jgi:four helix bundle protein
LAESVICVPGNRSNNQQYDVRETAGYQAAERLDEIVVALVATIPRGHAREIDQLKRASASVVHNIAEAHGCENRRKVAHLQIARGSEDETCSILRRLASRGALTQHSIERPGTLAVTIAKMLTSWIDRIEE